MSGDTVLVASPMVSDEGGVYVYVRSGTFWSQQARISSGGTPASAPLGLSVSVSGDTALIGGPGQASGAGAAYFFARSGTTWIQQQELTAPQSTNVASFGWAVVVAGDTAVVGQANPGMGPSSAYVYVRSGTAWALQQELPDGAPVDAGAGDGFGSALSLSGDTAIVGAPVTALGGNGAAFVFVRSGSTWTLEQQLVASDGQTGDSFGSAVAVEGDTAIVGAPNRLSNQGGIYVWNRSGNAWVETQLITPVALTAKVGRAVALSGGTVAVGGYEGETGGGVVSVYAPSGATLALQQALFPNESQPGDGFGAAVALDGTTLVAGAPGYSDMQGAAYVFTLGSTTGDPCTSGDACLSSQCVDGVCCNVAACATAGPCNAAETCQPGTGTCSLTPLHEGMPGDAAPLPAGRRLPDRRLRHGPHRVRADGRVPTSSRHHATRPAAPCESPAKADGPALCRRGVHRRRLRPERALGRGVRGAEGAAVVR